MRIGLLGFVLGLAVLACGESTSEEPGGGGGDGVDGDSREAHAAFRAAQVRAGCEREARCGRYSSVEACVEAKQSYAYEWFFGGVDIYADEADEYLLADEATREACLTALEDADCSALGFVRPEICDDALVARAPRAQGESCRAPSPYLPARPCQEGLACTTTNTCATCEPAAPRVGAGAPCLMYDDCELGLLCTGTPDAMTCVPPPGVGEPCPASVCEDDSACSSGVCVPFGGAGAACGVTAPCQIDLTCAAPCVPLRRFGETCSRPGAAESLTCVGWCVFDTPTSTLGTCGTPSNSGPTPCSRFTSSVPAYCPNGTYFDTANTGNPDSFPPYCDCLPQLPLGAACDASAPPRDFFGNDQCESGVCSSDGICVAKRSNGEACRSGGECQSGVCDADGVCTAAPCGE